MTKTERRYLQLLAELQTAKNHRALKRLEFDTAHCKVVDLVRRLNELMACREGENAWLRRANAELVDELSTRTG